MNKICGFFKEHRWLSNFWPCEIQHEGIQYSCVENAYQAMKTLDVEKRKEFQNISSAQAKKLGNKIELRKDWEIVKLSIMYDLLCLKFEHQSLREKLLATNNDYLEETNWWGDVFWGVCNGKGENHLGNLLMNIRSSIIEGKN